LCASVGNKKCSIVASNIPSDATYSLAVGHSTSLTYYACGVFDGQMSLIQQYNDIAL